MIKKFNVRKIKIIKNKINFSLIIYFKHFFGTCIYNLNIIIIYRKFKNYIKIKKIFSFYLL
jgi:hypothetical protein